MNLSSALDLARSSLLTSGAQSALVSRNLSGANEAGFSRRVVSLVSRLDGLGPDVSVARASDAQMAATMQTASSGAAASDAINAAYGAIETALGDARGENSLGPSLSALNASLVTYAGSPAQSEAGAQVLAKAQSLAGNLRNASASVQSARQDADTKITASVAGINGLLSDLESIDKAIVGGKSNTAGQADRLDARDWILSSLSEQIGIVVRPRADNSIAVYTDSGITLFDRAARNVSFSATPGLAAGASGNPVMIDGVDATGAASPMRLQSGKLAGLVQVRDVIAPQVQTQLDEVARALVSAFAERDQSANPTLPDRAGLFVIDGTATLPPASLKNGLASRIAVNANADPAQGGSVERIRDGGLADPATAAYRYNIANNSGYADRLNQMADAISAEQNFDPAAGLDANASIEGFSTQMLSAFEANRKSASQLGDSRAALRDQASQALGNATGVNIDDEMSRMLDIERSYQASAKLLTTANSMFTTLLQAL